MKNKRYCLHAHFDLPGREDPWLEEAEHESASWRYRSPSEQALHLCWGPNSASPLLDQDGRILELVNNYEGLSFSFAPDALAFMEREAPAVYSRILEADRASLRERGHGNALAAPYPSLILPLADAEERQAALRWGIDDFRRRFGRDPEGFWLPEGAVDEPTLEALIAEGLRFVLLSPSQAEAVRPVGSPESPWREVAPETLRTTRPYRWSAVGAAPPRHLDVFFHRRDLSPERLYERLPYAVLAADPGSAAREQVLDVGQRLANRLADSFTADDSVELSHAVSDGEVYGLARLHGNRALTFALDALAREAPAKAANYGEFLDLIPPPEEVRLRLPSSRGCPHGLARWSADCGCGSGHPPAVKTASPGSTPKPVRRPARWREPLRRALETLSRAIGGELRTRGAALFRDPAEAFAAYGALAFSCTARTAQSFIDRHSSRHLGPEESRAAMALCEAGLWRLKALGHRAWSDSDVSEPGAVHALACAARALELLERLDPPRAAELEKSFVSLLSQAPSHGTPYDSAAAVYTRIVRPRRVEMDRALAHFAVADYFDGGPLAGTEPVTGGARAFEASVTPLCRRTRLVERRLWGLSVCLLRVRRRRTFDRIEGAAIVLHSGGTDLQCWTLSGPQAEAGPMESTAAGLDETFLRKSPEALRAVAERLFGPSRYSIDALFPPARRAVITRVGARVSAERGELFARWHLALRRLSRDPAAALEASGILSQAAEQGLKPDDLPGIGALRRELAGRAEAFASSPGPESLGGLLGLLEPAQAAGLHINVWEAQDLALRGLKRWAGAELEEERRRLARALGLSDALFLWPPPAESVTDSGDSHGKQEHPS